MAWPMMALPADAESVVAVAILSTVWFSSFEVLWAKSPLPENFAVTWYDPAAKEDVVSVALPPDKAAVPSARVPFSNVTVPVAVAGDTVALNVTRSEEHTSELQSHRDLHSFPTRRSSDLGTAPG